MSLLIGLLLPALYFGYCGGLHWLLHLDWRQQIKLLLALCHERSFLLAWALTSLLYVAMIGVLNGVAEREARQYASFTQCSSASENLRRRTSY